MIEAPKHPVFVKLPAGRGASAGASREVPPAVNSATLMCYQSFTQQYGLLQGRTADHVKCSHQGLGLGAVLVGRRGAVALFTVRQSGAR